MGEVAVDTLGKERRCREKNKLGLEGLTRTAFCRDFGAKTEPIVCPFREPGCGITLQNGGMLP